MTPVFKNDFWALARENKGYYGWARKVRWQLHRALPRRYWQNCPICGEAVDSIELVQRLFENGLGLHPLLDIAFEAFARAEVRLGLRFVPQKSHEERLTGHLISELEAAIQMSSELFTREAVTRYNEPLHIDFVYSDLSRGGHLEKMTGGDFGLILVVDLPDRPKITRYAAFQSKRLNGSGSTSLNKLQFDTLTKNFGNASTYLFYDCDFSTLGPPMVMRATNFESLRNSKESTESFATNQSGVFDQGLPLSLWLLTELGTAKAGESARDFQSAMEIFTQFDHTNKECSLSRLAMVSIGRKFTVTPDTELGLRVNL
ncbi:hypothetical protein [Ereboglobus luteus]|uniref:Uncharacterized protein n=1 Tax=Ereboglobus luteus TaxID=1796921 RepID=A0A2U8E503_9BACT|nr:hypothetical protein [Ereboglobus luteus]AWI09931.1 hypothetical protein CKA38_12325 [Ereboglobus luteus]